MTDSTQAAYTGSERRSSAPRERRANRLERRCGLERRRGPGRRRGEVRLQAEEGEMTGELWEFVRAVDDYKRINERPFPSYSEIFEIVKYLGYRKVAALAEHINRVESEEAPVPVALSV